VGATLVILLGCIDLSVEGLMSAAGVAFVLLSANSRMTADLGLWAIVIGLALGALLGMANGLIHTLLKVPSFIVTLGMGFVGFGVATLLFGSDTLPFLENEGLSTWPTNKFFGLPNSVWLALAVVIAGVLVCRFTRLGRYTYAIGNNEQIARDNGVPVNRYKIIVFTIAGACSGLAGVIVTMNLGSSPARIGIGVLFLTIAAVVIGGTSLGGGKGGIGRTVIGVLMLTVINNGLILSGVSPNVQSAVSGGVLVIAIIIAAWPYRSRLRIMK
jgi:ribose transport system permease protein